MDTLCNKLMCVMKSIINYCFYYYSIGGGGDLAKLSTDYIPGSILGILHVPTHSSFKIILR